MQLLTMLNEMGGHIFVASTAGVHERSLLKLVLCLSISTCSEWNVLHAHYYICNMCIISCIVQLEVEHSFMHTTTLIHTTITMGTYSDTLQDWQHLTNVQHMQQVHQ